MGFANRNRFVLTLGFAIVAAPALADRIDGDWCAADGTGHFRIDGPRIVTVTGRETQGLYDRHAFAYVVPGGDPEAGTEVLMQLLGEEAVRVRFGAEEPRVWVRCKPIS